MEWILGSNYKIHPGHWWNLTASRQNPQAFLKISLLNTMSILVLSSPFTEKPKGLHGYLWNTNRHSLQLKWRHTVAGTIQLIHFVSQRVHIGCKLLDIKKHSCGKKKPKHFYEQLYLTDNPQTQPQLSKASTLTTSSLATRHTLG